MSERLLNHTEENTYVNPIDIATVIDLMSILVETQVRDDDEVELYVLGCRLTY